MPGGACGQFEFEFGFEFNWVPVVFAQKNGWPYAGGWHGLEIQV